MTALFLTIVGLMLGTAAPASVGAITAAQWVTLSLMAANDAYKAEPYLAAADQGLIKLVSSPAFRQWVAANGDTAIRLQPGIISTR